MKANEALDWVEPEKWRKTSAKEKLRLLKEVQQSIERQWPKLVEADCRMKKLTPNESSNIHQVGTSMQATVVPLASNVSACIDVYQLLMKGEMPQPKETHKVADGLYDLVVFPIQAKDKLLNSDQKGILRVKGEPKQVNPLDKEGGIIAVLGAGNYGSSFEMIRALFIENCAVVHKPHHLNAESDAVWEEILKPLVDYRAVSFCNHDGGQDLTGDNRLKQIYFTGGSSTAKAIMASSPAELISECGGNNPCIIIPGDRPWTEKEIEHHAMQIVTMGKLNGGAVCGRVQTLVTCRNWPQRRNFLDAMEKAIREGTPGSTTYYPGTEKIFAEFRMQHPSGKVIRPEDGAIANSEVQLIEDIPENGFGVTHEAFCQVFGEVALDTPADASAFLSQAVGFCNSKLLGTLGACILVDDDTQTKHQGIVDQAVTNLEYGGIAVNTMPPFVFMNPYLTWGGNEEGKEFVSGHGNFGNLMSFENVDKSIVTCSFMSPGHMLLTNKRNFYDLCKQATKYAIRPSWSRIGAMLWVLLVGKLKRKDF